jgi:hypothetical protein
VIHVLAAACVVFSLWYPTQVRASCADVALVLAIDGSASISTTEFSLQRDAYVAAFLDPAVQGAIRAVGIVKVGVVLWGDADWAPQVIPLQRIATAQDAIRFSGLIGDQPRLVTGNTDTANALAVALDMLAAPSICAPLRLIDLSSDGRVTIAARRTAYVPLHGVVNRARKMGVVINVIAITDEDPDLAHYFRRNIMTGQGAFVMEVQDFRTFGNAIVDKLRREILSGLPRCVAGQGRESCS